MEDFVLLPVTGIYAEDIFKFKNEMIENGDKIHGFKGLDKCNTFEELYCYIHKESKFKSFQFICVRLKDNKIVGCINYRYGDEELFETSFGHIGYSIRPSERHKGICIKMVKLLLPYCLQNNDRVLMLTCDENNSASRNVILRLNGVLFDKVFEPTSESNYRILERYLVDTKYFN